MELNYLGHSVSPIDAVHKTLRQMMQLRGYDKLTEALKPPTAEPVIIASKTRKETICTAREKEIYIFISHDPKLVIEHVRRYYKVAAHAKICHILLIHGNGGITPSTNQEIARLQTKGMYIETFSIKRLVFNPVMTPYEVINITETEKILAEECEEIPWTDIQRRFHDWPAGTIVKRHRQRGNLCEDYVLRIVRGP
jgi:hypothetical protein